MSAETVVLTGGRVRTCFPGPAHRALAIRGERVLAVGGEPEVRAAAGRGAQVVDLAGRAVIPGLIDAHVHPVMAGLTLAGCSLGSARDADDAVAIVRRYAAAHPDLEWIIGGGWSMEWFPGGTPAAALLDEIAPGRSILLVNADGHGAWASSTALARAGVHAGTMDPADGRIERLADGSPQGTLHEGAMELVTRRIPPPDEAALHTGLMRGQAHLHSLGVTGWQDAIVGSYAILPDTLGTYLAADRSGDLTGRVVGALWWDRLRGIEQLPEIVARRDRARAEGGRRFRAETVKIMQDGVAENHTAALLSPYLDACGCGSPGSGLSYLPPQLLTEVVAELDRLGFQIHLHALGDRAVREALDALAAARLANGPGDHRHHLAHLQVVDPDDIPRFAELGASANLQALWACHGPQLDELTNPFLGPVRVARQYPFAALAAAGAHLCAGSDWPVSSADPLQALHVAVTRQNPDDPTLPAFLPEQRLDVATFLRAYTAGSAWINHSPETGTLEPGQLADLAVLDDDPMTTSSRLCDLSVTATVVGGEVVHGAL